MDWRVNPHNDKPKQNLHRKAWQFSYWGDTAEQDTSLNQMFEVNPSQGIYPLTKTQVGQKVWLVDFQGQNGKKRLAKMGLFPGQQLEIISSRSSGSMLVAVQEDRIGIGAGMADKILVSNEPVNVSPQDSDDTKTYLRELPVGSMGCVVGYDQARRGYKGKLLSMGLTPGTPFKVVRVAPLGDPIEIELRGFHLSLRKYEADALVVEPLDSEE
ncbi:FeoA family protein [Spirulina sp. CS-785/01]|uniref:FeoA family protein n=1 Tax=Spirulina sp. CS-785/01 TaxID=3021716 RepID=UPI00232C3B0C|nr:FeoA family protein [Spirulina sp. CS-785/01]MDB9312210.1 FeoA family protein [Spirulina sp. CS-785/01]